MSALKDALALTDAAVQIDLEETMRDGFKVPGTSPRNITAAVHIGSNEITTAEEGTHWTAVLSARWAKASAPGYAPRENSRIVYEGETWVIKIIVEGHGKSQSHWMFRAVKL